MTLIRFTPSDPIDVQLTKGCVEGPTVGAEFWKRIPAAEKIGCYIFAVPRKYGQDGFMPLYVGRTDRGFSDEYFNPSNLNKINQYLRRHPADTLTLILLPHPPRQGGPNQDVIADLERELIKMAKDLNRNVVNKQHVYPYRWGIHGVIRGGKGKAGPGAVMLAQMLGTP